MTTSLFDIRDQVVVLTGGLGQLGRQFTRVLLEAGARVAIFDVQGTPALASARLGELAGSEGLLVLPVDITKRAELQEALGRVTAAWGVPHALINNAAVDSPPDASAEENGPFETYPISSWDQVMQVNVRGTVMACQVVGGAMAKAGRGSIINISSIYGLVSPDQRLYEYRRASGEAFFKPAAYAASKSALLNLTRYLATYWAPHNVRVNTLTFAGVFNHQDARFLEAYNPRVPLGRMAREDEYNGAVIFLLSQAASYMTGSNLVLDGGWTAW
jgi:NAD(P)-dependent dehydrogenase (short-subunit alcohol dehydrogenase family)